MEKSNIDSSITKNFEPLLRIGFTHVASKDSPDRNKLFTHTYNNKEANRNVEVTVSLQEDGLTTVIIISKNTGENFTLLDWAHANHGFSVIASNLIEINKSKYNLEYLLIKSVDALLMQLREILVGNSWIDIPIYWGGNR